MSSARLLLILTEFPPSFGGMQTHAVHLCRYLSERGYSFEVATYRGAGAEAVDSALPYRVHRMLSRIGFQENLARLSRLIRVGRFDAVYASTVFYGHLRERCGVPVVCRSAGNDVLRPWIAWPNRFGSRLLTTPWIEDELYRRFRKLDWPERAEAWLLARRRALMRESALAIDRILANSDYTARLLWTLGVDPARVRVVPGGVDSAHFARPEVLDRKALRRQLGLPPKAYLLFTACRLVPKKGLEFLIATLAALRRTMPDLHLAIAGEGREKSKLAHAEGVTWVGRVEHSRPPMFYWAADQFVLPSREHIDPRTGLRDVETMGRVLCEANAASTPAVTSRSGGIPSVVTDGVNGLLFEPEDAAGLAAAIGRVREDRRLRQHLCAAGLRRAVEEFDWTVVLGAHQEELERNLGRSGSLSSAVPPAGRLRMHGTAGKVI